MIPMLAALILAQEVRTETVEYKHDDVVLEGYLAYDTRTKGRRPTVLIVHEWKGLGDYAKMRAEQIAKLGYLAFAIDMYGKGKRAKNHEEAAELSGVYFKDRSKMRSRAKAALDWILKHELCDSSRVAAMGYCFGGTTVLEMARAGMELKVVGSFHGNLETPSPAEAGKVKAKVRVFHGADDRWVGDPKAFRKEMENAKVDYEFHEFEGAVHSFTVKAAGNDPSKGMAYNDEADEASWELWTEALERAFRK
jgi:dienelactone hydrolase